MLICDVVAAGQAAATACTIVCDVRKDYGSLLDSCVNKRFSDYQMIVFWNTTPAVCVLL
jgi:hypothetical protein